MAEFDGRTVLITGGGSGIGLATAHRLIDEGANVVLAARRVEKIDTAAKELDPTGRRVLTVSTDVSRLDELDELINRIEDRFGRLQGVFANAGIAMRSSYPQPFSEDEFDQMVSTNFKGTFYTVRKSLPLLDEGGAVVLNATCLVHHGMGLPLGLATAYATTKSAVANLARSLAADLAAKGVRINVVSPGFIETDMFEALAPTGTELRDVCRAQVPLGRLGLPGQVADAVAFLLSSRAAYITGQDLGVDGGLAVSQPVPPMPAR